MGFKLIGDYVHGRRATKLVGIHSEKLAAELPVVPVHELGDAPEAESVDFVAGKAIQHRAHGLNISIDATCALVANSGEVSCQVRLLTVFCDMELIDGPQWHCKSGRLCLALGCLRVVSRRVVELLAYDAPDHSEQHVFDAPDARRHCVPSNVARLQAKVDRALRHLLEANLHTDLPRPPPPHEVLAVRILTRGLTLAIVRGPVQHQDLQGREVRLSLKRLPRVRPVGALGGHEGPAQRIVELPQLLSLRRRGRHPMLRMRRAGGGRLPACPLPIHGGPP
mmetsp:Transcript_101981/g.263596  ORF Transcript_101981/g.263596 Transcript_101981/m.263596 type:complete len:280 (+) Transcript_101981:486-1325(+)